MPEAEVRGAMHSMWQIAITPMIKPGRYVFHAPGTEAPKVEGAQVFESPTNSMFFGIRLMATDEKTRKEALSQIAIYPLIKKDNPGDTRVVVNDERKWQGWQPRGLAYFERGSRS